MTARARLRDLGVSIGRYPTGPLNAITDVAGVRVGHTTLISGEGALDAGKGPVRTGVTCVMPDADIFCDAAHRAARFVLNGAGEVTGLTQVAEWGLLETPILLTNTLSVGKVSDAGGQVDVEEASRHRQRGGRRSSRIVGECDDSYLNDAVGRHIRSRARVRGHRAGRRRAGRRRLGRRRHRG